MAWFFSSAGGLVFFKHWPTFFLTFATQVGDIATQVGTTPANFSPGVFAMIRNVSESVIIPIAGLILTFIACYELIQMIIDHNNLANFETSKGLKRKLRESLDSERRQGADRLS